MTLSSNAKENCEITLKLTLNIQVAMLPLREIISGFKCCRVVRRLNLKQQRYVKAMSERQIFHLLQNCSVARQIPNTISALLFVSNDIRFECVWNASGAWLPSKRAITFSCNSLLTYKYFTISRHPFNDASKKINGSFLYTLLSIPSPENFNQILKLNQYSRSSCCMQDVLLERIAVTCLTNKYLITRLFW